MQVVCDRHSPFLKILIPRNLSDVPFIKIGTRYMYIGRNPPSLILYKHTFRKFESLFLVPNLASVVACIFVFFYHFLMPSHRQQLRHLVRNNIFTRVYSRICDTARDGGVGGGSSEILNILCLQLQCKLYVHTVGLRSAFISQGGKYIFCNYYFFIIFHF